jgi:predicted RNase H-like HicB family nuclease
VLVLLGPHGLSLGSSCAINPPMNLTFETELATDGRWIVEVPQLPGVLAYGATQQGAIGKAESLALCVLAERIEHSPQ